MIRMPTTRVRDAQIEYDEWGSGERNLLLIPGAVISDAFRPLASELTRGSSHDLRIVGVHRRGYGGSSRPAAPFSIEDQALDCLGLMDRLGLDRAHVVGHSMSGLIALQLAQIAPARIASLTLVEPSLIGFVPSAPQAAQSLAKVGALFQSGDRVGAVDTFMRGVSGEDYRTTMDRALRAGWFEEAAQDLDVFFQIELPAIRAWRFEAKGDVRQPILSIYGTEKRWGGTAASGPEFDQVVRSWFPQTASLAVQGAHHWPHVTNTPEVASELTEFVKKRAS